MSERKRGRPTKYTAAHVEQAYKLCLLGATDREMADFFEVDEKTFNVWKSKHPAFRQSLTRGKAQADAEVAQKLYHRALGYSHKAVKIFNEKGEPMIVEYDEHYPPDTQAASLWLRNRQPEKWRDRQVLEHTGKDGGPIQTEDLSALSPVEREQRLLAVQLELARVGERTNGHANGASNGSSKP